VDDGAAWRDDFPVPLSEEQRVTRRTFTKSLAGFSCAAFAGTAGLAFRGQPAPGEGVPALRVAGVDEVPVGGATVFGYPSEGDPCVLVRLDPETFVAFGQKCTHLGCPVTYHPASTTFHCPCHEGFFSGRDGAVLAGPPPRPLPRIRLERRGDELWAVGVVP
jgi:arsenite oxidase small subunit